MKKLYESKGVLFAILWIIAYVVLTGMADSFSERLGIEKCITAPLHVIMTLFLLIWTVKSGLRADLGLDGKTIPMGKYLWFLPLVILCSTNLWYGVTLNRSVLESVLYVISMLCVGFLEEYIFRGLLFGAMVKDGVKSAMIVSSLTFGIGHIVNLLGGAPVVDTLLQIVYATAIGFLFTVIYYKSKNLLPCIIAHSTINALSCFAVDTSQTVNTVVAILITVIAAAYGWYLLRHIPDAEASSGQSI